MGTNSFDEVGEQQWLHFRAQIIVKGNHLVSFHDSFHFRQDRLCIRALLPESSAHSLNDTQALSDRGFRSSIPDV